MEGDSVNPPLHITVVAYPSTKLDFTHELRMLKTAMLYADKVKLCGVVASGLVFLDQIANLDEDGRLELLMAVAEGLGKDTSPIRKYQTIKKESENQAFERRLYDLLRPEFEKLWDTTAKAKIESIISEVGGSELASALKSGLVELQLFDFSKDTASKDFLGAALSAVTSDVTYPLFDIETGELFEAAIELGKITPLGVSIEKARQVGLSSSLLNRLPQFEDATIGEIIDIRKELRKPLNRFRSAIIGFSDDIKSTPWNRDFQQEVQQVFYQRITPAMDEIEDVGKSNKLIQAIVDKYFLKAFPTSSILGFALSQTGHIDPVLSQLITLSFGAVGATYQLVRERREQAEAIQKHDLYFYYGVRERLKHK